MYKRQDIKVTPDKDAPTIPKATRYHGELRLAVKNISFESSFDTKNEITIKIKKYPTIRKRMKVGVIIDESFLN